LENSITAGYILNDLFEFWESLDDLFELSQVVVLLEVVRDGLHGEDDLGLDLAEPNIAKEA
jgi:hypothetical protein